MYDIAKHDTDPLPTDWEQGEHAQGVEFQRHATPQEYDFSLPFEGLERERRVQSYRLSQEWRKTRELYRQLQADDRARHDAIVDQMERHFINRRIEARAKLATEPPCMQRARKKAGLDYWQPYDAWRLLRLYHLAPLDGMRTMEDKLEERALWRARRERGQYISNGLGRMEALAKPDEALKDWNRHTTAKAREAKANKPRRLALRRIIAEEADLRSSRLSKEADRIWDLVNSRLVQEGHDPVSMRTINRYILALRG
ncbi:hypothetical protein ACMDCR_31720 [Labrys okinawensis]|uniref:hypothetical protein n=1 Tax=Labrys okinawensis TaxID=346911 RepID=UPI0039BD824A